jgi:hypothetical protein
MRKSYLIFLIVFLTAASGLANEELDEKVELTKKEYLQFVIGSYLWGYNSFGTDIDISPNLIKINIYSDIDKRNVELVDSLKRGLEMRIRNLIKPIAWARDYKIDVSVHKKAGIYRWD